MLNLCTDIFKHLREEMLHFYLYNTKLKDVILHIPTTITFISGSFWTLPCTTFTEEADISIAVWFPHSRVRKDVFICFLHPHFFESTSKQKRPIFSLTCFSDLWAVCKSGISLSRPMQYRTLLFFLLGTICTSLNLPLSHSCFLSCFFSCIQPCLCECVYLSVIHDVCCSVLGRRPRWQL